MKIAVIGADTQIGRRIAKDAYHRRHEVTAIVKDPSLLDSIFYNVIENDDYTFDATNYDAVIDARKTTIIIDRSGIRSTLIPPESLDADGRRQGYYAIVDETSTYPSYIGEEDYALCAVDEAENQSARTITPVTDRAPIQAEENTGRRRYVAHADTGIAGKAYHLIMDDLEEYVVHFIADDTVLFAKKGDAFTTYNCKCLHCDDDVWMVMYLVDRKLVTLVLDDTQSLATMIFAEPLPKKPTTIKHSFLFGAIAKFNEDIPFRRHGFTDEMVGTKITWHYSPYVNITHCYVNESYMRNSLRGMKPLPADAAPEAVFDAEDRIRRWSGIFFEEPAQYLRINPHLYIVCLAESTRNRIDPMQGGGDMVLAINTRRMRDYGRGFHMGAGTPSYGLISVSGDWDDMPDPMDTAESPYLI